MSDTRGGWAAVQRRLLVAATLLVGVAVGPVPAAAADLNAVWPDLGLPGFKVSPFTSPPARSSPSRAGSWWS